jgi:preprotein translocase subunit SecE
VAPETSIVSRTARRNTSLIPTSTAPSVESTHLTKNQSEAYWLNKDGGFMAKKNFWKFLSEVRSEVRKVTWPNRRQLTSSTIAVIVILVFCGAFLALTDVLFTGVIGSLLRFMLGTS